MEVLFGKDQSMDTIFESIDTNQDGEVMLYLLPLCFDDTCILYIKTL